jgi:CheY-like chemotaxis protein
MSNILIAEDNALNRELLRELLEMRGHTMAEGSMAKESAADRYPFSTSAMYFRIAC